MPPSSVSSNLIFIQFHYNLLLLYEITTGRDGSYLIEEFETHPSYTPKAKYLLRQVWYLLRYLLRFGNIFEKKLNFGFRMKEICKKLMRRVTMALSKFP